MKNLVIFDWDGVIADSCAMFFDLYRQTAAHFRKEFPLTSLNDFRGWYDSAWEKNFPKLGFTPEEVPAGIRYLSKLVDYEAVPLFTDMPPILARLARRHTLAIASTTHSRHIRERLAREGAEAHFSCIVGGEGGTSEKESRIRRVLEEIAVPASSAVMVGDTVMDVVSAKALGIRSIAVSYGWNLREILEKAGPDHIIDRREELSPLIEKIFP